MAQLVQIERRVINVSQMQEKWLRSNRAIFEILILFNGNNTFSLFLKTHFDMFKTARIRLVLSFSASDVIQPYYL